MKIILLVCLLLFTSASSSLISANEEPEVATITRVIDGDTVELSDGRKLRYIGVNTPETQHPQKGQECFGQEAKLKNKSLVEGKVVHLEKDINDTDRYGRLLRYVYVDSTQINEQLVAEGFAYASAYPPDVKYQQQMNDAQKAAQLTGKGLWGADCPSGEVQGVDTHWLETLLTEFGLQKIYRDIFISLLDALIKIM